MISEWGLWEQTLFKKKTFEKEQVLVLSTQKNCIEHIKDDHIKPASPQNANFPEGI